MDLFTLGGNTAGSRIHQEPNASSPLELLAASSDSEISPASPDSIGGSETNFSKRTRTMLTPYQQRVLQRVLDHTSFPGRDLLDSLSRSLCLKRRTIQIWFQNQRQKAKTRSSRINRSALESLIQNTTGKNGLEAIKVLGQVRAGGAAAGQSIIAPNLPQIRDANQYLREQARLQQLPPHHHQALSSRAAAFGNANSWWDSMATALPPNDPSFGEPSRAGIFLGGNPNIISSEYSDSLDSPLSFNGDDTLSGYEPSFTASPALSGFSTLHFPYGFSLEYQDPRYYY